MDLKFAEYILALDEARNVTHAAEKLNMSQGALSNFLMKHEKEMGLQIFVRCRNVLIPTQLGQRYIDALRQMMTIKSYAYRSIRTQCAHAEYVIRIGVTPSRGLKNLTAAYSEYVKKYPEVKIDIREEYISRLKKMLADKEIDMLFGAMTEDEIETPLWVSYRTRPIRLVAAVHRFLLDQKKGREGGERFPSISCSELQGLPMIMHGERTGIRKLQDELFAREMFSPVVIAEGNNSKMVQNLIKAGLGVGFVPEHYMYEEGMEAVAGFFIDPPTYIHRCISVPRDVEMSEEQRYLADLMWEQEMEDVCG